MATYFHGQYFRSAVCGTDVDLDFLCGSLTDQQVVLLSHIADQRLIKIITRNLDGGATTVPPREMTAISAVPPPISTIMFPHALEMSIPAPMAAATGSSMMETSRAPA